MAIAFVLHGSADQQYAAALAEGLAPMVALATPFPQRGGAQFGSGAACVIVWSENAGVRARDISEALAHCRANVVVCRIGAASTPPEFSSAPFLVVDGTGEAARDTTNIREAIAAIDGRLSAPHSSKQSRLNSPGLYSAPPAPSAERADKRMAVRSAYGLAATLAVVGFVAPSIGQRAVATGLDHDAPAPAAPIAAPIPTQAAALASPSGGAQAAVQPISTTAHSDSPLLDHWLAPPSTRAAERLDASSAGQLIDYAPQPQNADLTVASAAPDGEAVFVDGAAMLSQLAQKPMIETVMDVKRSDPLGNAPAPDWGKGAVGLDVAVLPSSLVAKHDN